MRMLKSLVSEKYLLDEDLSSMTPDSEIFTKRRSHFQSQMLPNSIAFLFSSSPKTRSRDVFYPFRQDSDFFYLTGIEEPLSILVIEPEQCFLYLEPSDPEKEIWEGPKLELSRAEHFHGISKAKSRKDFFPKDISLLLSNRDVLYLRQKGTRDHFEEKILTEINLLSQRARSGKERSPHTIISPNTILHPMRLIKSSEEKSLLEENLAITRDAHLSLLQKTQPGMFEYELEAIIEYEFRKQNSYAAYPSIVASGKNACILHYTKNNRKIEKGDLILVDAGAEKLCMCTDITRTFPAGEKFSSIQKDVYEAVLESQKKAIRKCTVGSNMDDVHKEAVLSLIESLISFGILKGNPIDHWERSQETEQTKDAKKIKDISYKRYFMHRTGHWLGMDVHDVGSYYNMKKPLSLQNGMVCTVEPGLYFSPLDETIPREFRGIGVRIEDDVWIQDRNPIVLSQEIPKEVSDIEKIREESFEHISKP